MTKKEKIQHVWENNLKACSCPYFKRHTKAIHKDIIFVNEIPKCKDCKILLSSKICFNRGRAFDLRSHERQYLYNNFMNKQTVRFIFLDKDAAAIAQL